MKTRKLIVMAASFAYVLLATLILAEGKMYSTFTGGLVIASGVAAMVIGMRRIEKCGAHQ